MAFVYMNLLTYSNKSIFICPSTFVPSSAGFRWACISNFQKKCENFVSNWLEVSALLFWEKSFSYRE